MFVSAVLFVTILAAAVPSAGFESPYDNACVRAHLRLLQPAAAFGGDAQKMARFSEALAEPGVSGTLLDDAVITEWSEALLQRVDRGPAWVCAHSLKQGGCRNLGVFAVHTDVGDFAAKRSTRTFEAVRLAMLQMEMYCYKRERDVRDRNKFALWFAGDERRQARIMPLVAWDYMTVPNEDGTPVKHLPVMLLERARGKTLSVPDPARLDTYTDGKSRPFLPKPATWPSAWLCCNCQAYKVVAAFMFLRATPGCTMICI